MNVLQLQLRFNVEQVNVRIYNVGADPVTSKNMNIENVDLSLIVLIID